MAALTAASSPFPPPAHFHGESSGHPSGPWDKPNPADYFGRSKVAKVKAVKVKKPKKPKGVKAATGSGSGTGPDTGSLVPRLTGHWRALTGHWRMP